MNNGIAQNMLARSEKHSESILPPLRTEAAGRDTDSHLGAFVAVRIAAPPHLGLNRLERRTARAGHYCARGTNPGAPVCSPFWRSKARAPSCCR